ncbi:hypothetical protein [Flavobacterium sp. CF136]|uniref:hypothetical protein n=1 Tax=Flavobacterium sp. (strain CF136) TaxID=1144313 RepID=UPI0002719FCA|nr:hypothetical protein [Flavobacterium sp. CF136]EJL60265.1 hypothetical protein PMI10_03884 [Flavobacterium sp. CF136]
MKGLIVLFTFIHVFYSSKKALINFPPDDDNLTRCTYSLKLYSSTRKHNGDYGDSDGSSPLEQLFFYDDNQV